MSAAVNGLWLIEAPIIAYLPSGSNIEILRVKSPPEWRHLFVYYCRWWNRRDCITFTVAVILYFFSFCVWVNATNIPLQEKWQVALKREKGLLLECSVHTRWVNELHVCMHTYVNVLDISVANTWHRDTETEQRQINEAKTHETRRRKTQQ